MNQKTISRKNFLIEIARKVTLFFGGAIFGKKAISMPNLSNANINRKVIVLGIDGLDPFLLKSFIKRGGLPAFEDFIENKSFLKLQTTTPPQSPVAWSSFISGTNPGGHGIYDFIHRDPLTFTPYLSISRSYRPENIITIGDWAIPLEGGKTELLRHGPAFWEYLEKEDIPAMLYKLPANYPVKSGNSKILSGLGTPDLLGGYGTFTYYTDRKIKNADKITGGRVLSVDVSRNFFKSYLPGPPNPLKINTPETEIAFSVNRDPDNHVIKINIQDHEIILSQGEWSEWIPLKFELMPLFFTLNGMVRVFLQEVHPDFRLYFSPINIAPMDADLPISNPDNYCTVLSKIVGRYYTQGFPEDTKALSHNIFSDEEFIVQVKMILNERLRAFHHEYNQFKEGFFFFYFSTLDQISHMMWRCMDKSHPLYDPTANPEIKNSVYHFYQEMEHVLKETLSKMDRRSRLIILSDHGFSPFIREFNLSSWLAKQGYISIAEESAQESEFFEGVNWKESKAFALGLNGIYINLAGRELNGSVNPAEFKELKKEIIHKLEKVTDLQTGKKPIKKAYDSESIYQGPYKKLAPDIIIGYEQNYRISDESVLGKFPSEIFRYRRDKWAADHCMDPKIVPGVLLTNKKITMKNPGIWDIAPTILKEFGLKIPPAMDGRPIF
jgi:predicted AlkP superfamily phosphohydrolase/phosphomutase